MKISSTNTSLSVTKLNGIELEEKRWFVSFHNTHLSKKEITEEHAEELNLALQSLQKGDMAKITYYTAQGYVTEACEIREINCYLHYIRTDKKCFSFKDIWNIQTDAGWISSSYGIILNKVLPGNG